MCGIAGFIEPPGRRPAGELDGLARAMGAAIAHRGPDGDGVWSDPAVAIGLAHRRLAIIDLSDAAAQPMTSADGRGVLVFNGEIYNYRAIRAELEGAGVRLRTQSDTEALLEACLLWGVPAALARAVGMFAFALWRRDERTLTLARDRLGVKPLYWGQFGPLFLFGSELRALAAQPDWPLAVDRTALVGLCRFNYVPAPYSILQGVSKLAPGSILTRGADGAVTIAPYWSARDAALAGLGDPLRTTDAEAEAMVAAALEDSVRLRLVADVPVGMLLSSGVDSSAVAALMQRQAGRPIKTFTVGFDDPDYDESAGAAAIAAHIGAEHHEVRLGVREALATVPHLADVYDEPFADSAQVGALLVSRMARRHVTVALTGDGGDETFGGYNRYVWAPRLWSSLGAVPAPLRRAAGAVLQGSTPALAALVRLMPAGRRPRTPDIKLAKLAAALGAADDDDFYRRLMTYWPDPAALVPGGAEPASPVWDAGLRAAVPDWLARMQLLDALTYLPDDPLTKVDRASMAVGLEAREPLLDHRLFELAWRLPQHLKVQGGVTKRVLRRVAGRHLPPALLDRPKMGLALPIADWLRGELRPWAEAALAAPALRDAGFDPGPIRQAWAAHLAGGRNAQNALWPVLMFQDWRRAMAGWPRGPLPAQ